MPDQTWYLTIHCRVAAPKIKGDLKKKSNIIFKNTSKHDDHRILEIENGQVCSYIPYFPCKNYRFKKFSRKKMKIKYPNCITVFTL